jgi:hypothetical protein
MPKKTRRRRKQSLAIPQPQPAPATMPDPFFTEVPRRLDGQPSVDAAITVLQALTALPTDRAKLRVMRFVQDYFDERHGH